MIGAMLEDQTRKKTRQGTKSCTECRRRKVRCIRSSEDAPACRRCEERGSKCTAQTYSSSSSVRPQRLPSRYRISQLESEVASLSEVVHNIESKLESGSVALKEQHVGISSGSDDFDDASIVDVPAAQQPSHLRLLFQNDWLSVETHRQHGQVQSRNSKACAHLLDVAKRELRKLIPSKDEFMEIARSSSSWLGLLQNILPQPFAMKSRQELLESYEKMHESDVTAITMAIWLLTVAITAQQGDQECVSPAARLTTYQKNSAFSRAVSDTIESTILCHDRLISTIQGLGMALHFVRLQMSTGNFQKAWLQLRHLIAVAELMGLPKVFQAVELSEINGSDYDEMQIQKAQFWESICSADRLFGMFLNLPPGTRQYQHTKALGVTVDGVVQTGAYFMRLTDIATKVQDLDDMNTSQRSESELHAFALKIDAELKELSSKTPKSWWTIYVEHVKADHILQFLHYCMIMRVHLRFSMRRSPGDEYVHSRVACMDACDSVAKTYQFLRRRLPPGFLLARILDLQAFTASVVLLLTSYSGPSRDCVDLPANMAQTESVVGQVIKLMDEKSNDVTSSDFAQHCVTTIRSLRELLQQDKTNTHAQELTLKVPLLGNVHIRRNAGISQRPNAITSQAFRNPPEPSLWRNEPLITQPYERSLLTDDTVLESTLQPQTDWQWDPLSWSIGDYPASFFQDTLMVGNFDEFNIL